MTNHTDLIARLRDTASRGVSVWGDLQMGAADALEAAQAEIERLTADRRVLQADGKHPAPCAKFCEATAFTIELRRAQAEIERLTAELGDLPDAQADMLHTIKELRARIAKLEPKRNVSPPSEALVLHKMRYHFWDAEDDEPADFELFDAGVECDTCIDVALVRQDRLDELIAAGASPVEPNFCESCAMGLSTCDCVTPRPVFVNQLPSAQPSQAQPPAPSEAAREYMTGYSDGREWAGATSQAVEPTEAQLVAGVKAMRLFVTKNSIKDFRDGFIAAINAKESK